MALRIGNPTPTPPTMSQQEAIAEPAVMPMDEMMQPSSGGLVSPEIARYLGPEAVCATCIHFIDPGSCEIVSGEIDPQGRCCLHEADDSGIDTETEEAADTLEAMPVAEDVVPVEDEEEAY